LEAGKHVICEKPLAPTPDDIKQLIAARDKSGKLLMTAQHMRYEGHSRALKAKSTLENRRHLSRARLDAAPRRDAAQPRFIYKKNSGGGPCIDIGVHVLDTTLWMMGHPKPISVTGVTQDKLLHQPGAFSVWGGAIPTDIDVEEFAAAMVRFDNGATLILEVSWMLHHATDVEEMKIWLYGDKGGALWPQNTLYTTDNATQQQFDTTLKRKDDGKPHALECIAFADAVANGKPSPVPAEQSLDVQTILHGLYRSAEENARSLVGII
jgi:predicted dehydrogenase